MSNIELPNHSGFFNNYYIYIIIIYLCIIQDVEDHGLFIHSARLVFGAQKACSNNLPLILTITWLDQSIRCLI